MTLQVDEAGGEIKPGQSLYAPEWEAYWRPHTGKLRGKRALQEEGFAGSVVMVMYQRGWWAAADLPANDDLARLIRCCPADIKLMPVLRSSFERIPNAVLRAQIARIHRWPMWMVRELSP